MAVQDTILTLDEIPTQPVKAYARNRTETGGGPAATAAVSIACLGGRAGFAGRIGADSTGAAIRQGLEAEGVDTRNLRAFEGAASPASTVLVDAGGERMIIVHAPPLPPDASWLAPDLATYGAVLCDLTWIEGALRLLDLAQHLPRVLDIDVIRHPHPQILAALRLSSHAVLSRRGLAELAGTDDIARGLDLLHALAPEPGLLGVTDGAAGLWRWTAQGPEQSLPPKVVPVDTTGAGDAFHGALAFGLALGWPDEKAIDLAHTVAALKCTRPGGRAGLPDRAALTAFAPRLDPFPEETRP